MKKIHTKALVVGYGTIGKPLVRALQENGVTVAFVVNTKGVHTLRGSTLLPHQETYEKVLSKVDIACIALSAPDEGQTEYTYTRSALDKGKTVITCAKRALGNNLNLYRYASSNRPLLGIDATVGGNSGILPHLKNRLRPNLPVEIHLVLNGSMNCFMFELSNGQVSPSEAMAGVLRQGLAEPIKAKGKYASFFAGETDDTVFKTSIVVNYCGLLDYPLMHAKSVRLIRYLDENALRELFRSRNRRYIVSIYRDSFPQQEDVIGGFTHVVRDDTQGNICISAGFKLINTLPYSRLHIPGAFNAVLTIEGEDGRNGTSYLEGVGAGPDPTVAAMIQNLKRLIER